METKNLIEKIPSCSILGVNISAVNMPFVLDYLTKHISEVKGKYVCVANVHTTIMASENDKYKNIQNNAFLTIPDGGPLSKVGRRRGFPNMQRTTGPDLMREIFAISAQYGYKHYFYGSTEDTVEKMIANVKEQYKGIDICGYYCPPFRNLTEIEDAEIISKINAAEPDFIWVGLGAPKQEYWMSDHSDKIAGLMLGTGAAFDYFAGNIKRAPEWMQKYNLEWLYRLIQEPRRLLKRYFVTNTKFIWKVIIRGK